MNNSGIYSLSRVLTHGVIVGAVVGAIAGFIASITTTGGTPPEYRPFFIAFGLMIFSSIGGTLGAVITLIMSLLYRKSKGKKSPRLVWVIVVGLGAILGFCLFCLVIPPYEGTEVGVITFGIMIFGILGAAIGWVATKTTITSNYEQGVAVLVAVAHG